MKFRPESAIGVRCAHLHNEPQMMAAFARIRNLMLFTRSRRISRGQGDEYGSASSPCLRIRGAQFTAKNCQNGHELDGGWQLIAPAAILRDETPRSPKFAVYNPRPMLEHALVVVIVAGMMSILPTGLAANAEPTMVEIA